MGKILKMVLLSILFMSAWKASAQSSFEGSLATKQLVSVGVAVPMGAFGETTGADAGAAETGFGVNYSSYIPMNENIYTYVGTQILVNGFNTSGTPITKAGSYSSLTLYVGIGPKLGENDLTFVINPLIGFFYGSTPELESPTFKMTSASAYAFSYGAALGLLINNIGISMQYNYAKPEYEFTVTGNPNLTVKQPTGILCMTVGYSW